MSTFEATLEFARSLDARDPLAAFRDRFRIPSDADGKPWVYLCGNSLGLQPCVAGDYVDEVMNQWATLGVEGHFKGPRPWLRYHRLANEGFAALAGAERHEVVAMNTLTVNLHLLMAGFYRPQGKRRKILVESTAFPSDYFAVESQIRLHGLDPQECIVEWRPREDQRLHTDDLDALFQSEGPEIALVLLPGVQYLNGQVLDMRTVCRMAGDNGCIVGLDLAHAIGNVPLALHDWGADFATWCTYKYLNSGPGAIGGAFVHARHLDDDAGRQLTGWWGHDERTRFRMEHRFQHAAGAERWQLSNPPILSLAPVVASLGIFLEAGIEALRRKSLEQTAFLEFLLDSLLSGRVESITPMDARGCQLSLVVTQEGLDPKAVFRSLEAARVIGDWREPDVIRVAPVPLYNSFEDIFELAVRLTEAIEAHEPE